MAMRFATAFVGAPWLLGCDPPAGRDRDASLDGAGADADDAADAATGGPRLVAPLSTSIVTSRRPTLRWGPMPDGARARVALCDDPSCARVLTVLDTASGSARLEAVLRPGPVFWRVRVTPATGAAWESPTWEFFVTPHDSDVDTTRCCVTDVNRDGVPDIEGRLLDLARPTNAFAVGPVNERFWSTGLLVSSDGGYRAPVWTVAPELPPSGRGSCYGPYSGGVVHHVAGMQYTGDNDGDGFGDLAIAVIRTFQCGQADTSAATIRPISGGARGLTVRDETIDTVRWDRESSESGWLWASPAGDVNGDGFGDLAFERQTFNEEWLSYSAAAYSSTVGGALFNAVSGYSFRGEGSRFNDVARVEARFAFDGNGDGRHDTAALELSPLLGTARLVVTTAAGSRDITWHDEHPEYPGQGLIGPFTQLASPGDLDGDGYEELVVDFDERTDTPERASVVLRGSAGGYSLDRTLPFE